MPFYDRQGRVLPDTHAEKWREFATRVFALADELLGPDNGILLAGGFDSLGTGENEVGHIMSTNLTVCGAYTLAEMVEEEMSDAHDEHHGRGIATTLRGEEALAQLPEETRELIRKQLAELGLPPEQVILQTRVNASADDADSVLDAWASEGKPEDEVETGE